MCFFLGGLAIASVEYVRGFGSDFCHATFIWIGVALCHHFPLRSNMQVLQLLTEVSSYICVLLFLVFFLSDQAFCFVTSDFEKVSLSSDISILNSGK